MDLPCCQNDTSSFFQFSHINIAVFFFTVQSSSLSTLLEIDEQRRFGNKSDPAKTPTRGGSLLSTGGKGGGFFLVSFVRDGVVPSFRSSCFYGVVRAMCAKM